MPIKDIDIKDLKVGMCVVGLDISWLDSPFILHTRKIKDQADILKLLKAGAKNITIDLDKSKIPVDEPKPVNEKTILTTPSKPKLTPEEGPKTNKVIHVGDEIREANKIHQKLTNLTRSLFDKINKGETVDISPLDELISRTISSLSRNEQALFALLHMQRKAGELYQHAVSVFSLSLSLAQNMGLSEIQCKQLGYAALMHDAGWLKLPMQLFGKGKAYTENEHKLVGQHTLLSCKMMESMEGISADIKLLIAGHHERENGSGYPSGKPQINTALWGILSVADRYDELVHQLLDQPGVVPKSALKILYTEAKEGLLNSAAVQSLIGLLGVFPISSAVELNTGEKAVVIECFREHPSQPVIRIYYDKKGGLMPKPLNVNLSKQKHNEERSIKQVLNPQTKGIDPADLLNIDPKELM